MSEVAENTEASPPDPHRLIWVGELPALLRCDASTIRRYRAQNKLPTPDVAINPKRTAWRQATLWAAGVRV